jgi:hypothetical protein
MYNVSAVYADSREVTPCTLNVAPQKEKTNRSKSVVIFFSKNRSCSLRRKY